MLYIAPYSRRMTLQDSQVKLSLDTNYPADYMTVSVTMTVSLASFPQAGYEEIPTVCMTGLCLHDFLFLWLLAKCLLAKTVSLIARMLVPLTVCLHDCHTSCHSQFVHWIACQRILLICQFKWLPLRVLVGVLLFAFVCLFACQERLCFQSGNIQNSGSGKLSFILSILLNSIAFILICLLSYFCITFCFIQGHFSFFSIFQLLNQFHLSFPYSSSVFLSPPSPFLPSSSPSYFSNSTFLSFSCSLL